MYMPSSLLHPSRDSLVYMEFPSGWVVPATRFLSINSSSLPSSPCFFLHRYFHCDRCLLFPYEWDAHGWVAPLCQPYRHSSIWGLAAKSGNSWILQAPNLHFTMQLLTLSVNNALQDYKDTKCQFQHLTLFKIANQRTEYIKQNEHVSSYLNDNQKADTRAKIRRVTIHSSHNIHHSLANGNNHAKY